MSSALVRTRSYPSCPRHACRGLPREPRYQPCACVDCCPSGRCYFHALSLSAQRLLEKYTRPKIGTERGRKKHICVSSSALRPPPPRPYSNQREGMGNQHGEQIAHLFTFQVWELLDSLVLQPRLLPSFHVSVATGFFFRRSRKVRVLLAHMTDSCPHQRVIIPIRNFVPSRSEPPAAWCLLPPP